jgi:hypothetical protein
MRWAHDILVTQLSEALETSEGVAEVVQMGRFVGVSMRGEISSIPVPRNRFLEVTQLPEVIETRAK